MANILKKLLAVAVFGGLVAVVAYAMVKPEPVQEARDSPRGRGGGSGGGAPVVPVLANRAARQDVPVRIEAVGTVRPAQTVTIRPQVDGRILRVAFREGQDVAAGDLLAEIDPATYQAALDQAVARREVTATQLANARRDYDRMARIPNVMAQKTMDTQQAQVDQLEAQLKADDATVASARTILGYTRITSPISGRTGFRLVDEGNLVRSGDAGLVTISEIDPITVHFTIPQQRLGEVQRALTRGPVRVEAIVAEGGARVEGGKLDVIDNQIDATTGTIRMKAIFPNAERRLWPGQFINVNVEVDTLRQVVTVPTAAVQRGPAGTFVWAVGADSSARIVPVETGLQTELLAVVTKGLEGEEQVVTTGFARISEGARLVVRDAPASAPVSYAPPARGRRDGKSGEKGKRRPAGEETPAAASPKSDKTGDATGALPRYTSPASGKTQ